MQPHEKTGWHHNKYRIYQKQGVIMRQIWVTLVSGEYGFMWGTKLPLPGDRVRIQARGSGGLLYFVEGVCSRASW